MSLINEPPANLQNDKLVDDQTNEPVKSESTADAPTESKPEESGKMEVDQWPESAAKADVRTPADPCRVQIADDQIDSLTKEDLLKKWKQQNDYIVSLEQKLKQELSAKEQYQDNEDKIKQQLFDLTRKENILMMKLTTKEHEIQDYLVSLEAFSGTSGFLSKPISNRFLTDSHPLSSSTETNPGTQTGSDHVR